MGAGVGVIGGGWSGVGKQKALQGVCWVALMSEQVIFKCCDIRTLLTNMQ